MPLLFDSGPRIKPEEFRLIRDLVNDFCGIRFPDDMQFVLERKLKERLAILEIADFAEYYHYLRYHPDARTEIERAIDALTTNETYLFREEYQLRAFQHEVLPLLHERGVRQKRLSIWSAGCSTGEEVYTLAILIRESRMFEGWDVRVIGNDISRRVLQVARRATYGNSSFRSMPSSYQEYFSESPDGRTVRADIRAMCNFAHLNLLDAARYSVIGAVDAVFCRNVLIYFDTASRRKVIEGFYERLQPGGFLFLGHSESLLNVSTAFELVHLSSDLVYRRPLSHVHSPARGGTP
ncbi:MAG: protein-glutamate O-methyltransferase CheR [Myxococcales bacterium]